MAKCPEKCPEEHPCILNGDVPHKLHICHLASCPCHSPKRYGVEVDRSEEVKWTQVHPNKLARHRLK